MLKLSKKLVLIAIAIMLAGTTVAQQKPVQQTEKKAKTFYGNIIIEPLLSGSFSSRTLSLQNIPVDIRNVPIHSADTYVPATNAGPIEVSSLTAQKFAWIPITLGLNGGLATSKFEFEAGLFFSMRMTSQDFVERNYTNSVGTNYNGMGAALTYITLDNFNLMYGYNASIRYKIVPVGPEENVFLSLKYMKGWQEYSLTTGWDRYGEKQPDKSYKIGIFTNQSMVLGPEIRGTWGYVGLFFGYGWSNVSNLSNWGQQMIVGLPKSFDINLTIGAKFDSRK